MTQDLATKIRKAAEFDEEKHNGRSWYREHGFIRSDKDEFKSHTTFQDIAKKSAQDQHAQTQWVFEALEILLQAMEDINDRDCESFEHNLISETALDEIAALVPGDK